VSLSPSRLALRLALPAVVGLGLWSAATLRFQTELLPLFPQDLASVQALAHAQRDLVSARQLIAVPVVADGAAPDWQGLAAVAEKLRAVPGVAAARIGFGADDALPRLAAGIVAGLPADRFAAFAAAVRPDAAEARLRETREAMGGALDEAAMARLRFDPLRLGEILFPPGTPNPMEGMAHATPVLSINADRPLPTFAENQAFTDHVRAALAEIAPGTRFLLTGPPAFTAEISRQMRRDLGVMLAFALVLILLAFWCVYRTLMPLLWIVLVQGLAALCAVIAARLAFGQLNILSLGFAAILPGLGVDYSILAYHHFALRKETDPAAWRALRRTIWCCALAMAGTFGLLVFSSFPGLRQLAVLLAAGLLGSAFFATTLLAELLAHRPPRAPAGLETAADGAARLLSRRRTVFRLALGLAGLGALGLAFGRPLYDTRVERLQPTGLEAYRAQEKLQQNLAGMALPAATGDVAANRRAWTPIDPAALDARFRRAGFGPAWSAPTLQALALLNRWHAGTAELAAPGQAGDAWARLRGDLSRVAVADFTKLSLLNLALVVAVCLIARRSFRLVALNLAALAFALLLLAGLLALSHATLTLVSLLCVPLLIGLTVSYSLYVLLGLENAGGDLALAFRRIAVPLGLTGFCSLIGFTALTLAGQPVLQNFGWVMDLGTFAAMAAGLVLTPILYPRLRDDGDHHAGLYHAGAFAFGAALARRLPLGLIRAIASAMGGLWARTHPCRVAVVERNLQLLDPQLGPAEARQVYREFGKTLADYFYIGTRPPAVAARIIIERRGLDHLHAVAAEGKGGLLVTAHHGLFELGGLIMAQAGLPIVALTLPEPCPRLTAWRTAFRRGWGVETLETGHDRFAFLEIANRLRAGHFVAALIDRPGADRTVPVALPNGSAEFSSGILLLALQCGAPVLPVTMVRRADGRYEAEVFAPIHLQNRGSREETLRFYTQQIADMLLPTLCRHPEQWYQFVPLGRSSSPAA
jgi:lauroyl/myristoyl acyltransferase